MKAEGKRRAAKVKTASGRGPHSRRGVRAAPFVALTFCLLPFCACLLAAAAGAQKRPKPALKQSEARRVIAATPGFGLRTGAVKVVEISPAGSEPVTVTAEVTEAFRLAGVEDERAPQTGGAFKTKRWRAVEFRTGDRAWEEFDSVAAAAGAERVEAARRAIEELVTEFEARLRESKGKAVEPLARGPLTIKSLSAMGSSAVAEFAVAATFRLARDERGRRRVSEVVLGGETFGDLASLWRAADERKAALARADLSALRDALEAFRAERGFYVEARDSVVLLDHLSPRYLRRVIRIDPWRNPYRYEGTASSYALASDGPDGKPHTPDDITLAR